MNANTETQSNPWITADHLTRLAVIYIRQSTEEQVRENTGALSSKETWRALLDRTAGRNRKSRRSKMIWENRAPRPKGARGGTACRR